MPDTQNILLEQACPLLKDLRAGDTHTFCIVPIGSVGFREERDSQVEPRIAQSDGLLQTRPGPADTLF